jgi:hypothetical protein
MYERMKAFLHQCINMVVALILVGVMMAYFIINSVIMSSVINDLRLDTYVGYDTGFSVVLLIFLLGWVPFYVSRQHMGKRS